MVPATNEFRACPVCNGPLKYKMWEDPIRDMTYLKLYCPNGFEYDKQYATGTRSFMQAVVDMEKNNGR